MNIKKTKRYDEMNYYEKKIAEVLHDSFNYDQREAIDFLERYYPVLERLGWYESPENRAKVLHEIIKDKITPEEWNEHINKYKTPAINPLQQKKVVRTWKKNGYLATLSKIK